MTLVDDPPQVEAPPRTNRSRLAPPSWSTWRFSLRLARREVRRRPGRTALVGALVAVPILAMTLAATIALTQAGSAQERFERTGGQADLIYQGTGGRIEAALPSGSRVATITSLWAQITLDGETTPYVDFRVVPFGDPLVDGIFQVRQGRVPQAPGEVLLQQELADDLGVGVGDTFELDQPSGSWTVVGIGRSTDDFNRPLFAVSEFPAERITDGFANSTGLVDLPDSVTRSQLTSVVDTGGDDVASLSPVLAEQFDLPMDSNVLSYFYDQRGGDVPTEALAWGWVAGVLALVAVGVIIAAAFASSARRQLATIGQLAANGAPERLVRRTLALQGAWTGLIGSMVGIAAGLAVLPLLRPLLDRLFARPLGPWTIEPTALLVVGVTGIVAATIAAMIPARSASRIPVLAALAGRRPLGTVPRWLVPIGLVSFVAGVGLLVLVTVASTNAGGSGSDANLFAAAAVIGGLLVVGGMCCASPIAVDLIGRVGARLTGTWRLAARSVARSRTRSAGVLTAIAVTGAAAIAITTAVGSVAFGDETRVPIVPRDTVVLTSIRYDYGPPSEEPVEVSVSVGPLDDELLAQVRQVVPDAEISPRRVVLPEALTNAVDLQGAPLLVADGTTRDLLGLSARDTAAFDRAGFLDTSGWSQDPNSGLVRDYTTRIGTPSGVERADVVVVKDRLDSRAGHFGLVITEERARELGLDVSQAGVVLRSSDDLTRGQVEALDRIQQGLFQSESTAAFVEPGDPLVPAADLAGTRYLEQRVVVESNPVRFPRALLDATALVAALLLTLMVVAIGLSLAATESRDERDVLLAVGATPRTMRGLAAIKAVVLTAGAAVLAIPTGFIPVAAVLQAAPDSNRATFPWLTALGLILVVPILAGLAALITSAIAQQVRPIHMSTLTED